MKLLISLAIRSAIAQVTFALKLAVPIGIRTLPDPFRTDISAFQPALLTRTPEFQFHDDALSYSRRGS